MASICSEFVTEPEDDLLCVICLEVAEEPWQHGECGRLFCKQCLDKLGRDKPCPNCRRKKPQYFQDNRSKRVIRSLRVKCPNVDRKCEWVGTVDTIEKHVATCEFSPVSCPKKCGDKEIMRQDLDKHLREDCPNREYQCTHCEEKGTYAIITGNHDRVCKLKILPCTNDECSETMQRQNLCKHVSTECKYTVISCKYKKLGCSVELKREFMMLHEEDDKLHLHMAIDTVTSMEKRFATMTENGSITFKVTEYQKKKSNNTTFYSPSFYTSPKGYHMATRVYINGCGTSKGLQVSIFAHFLKGDDNNELSWPFAGDITFTLLNQLEDDNHHSMTLRTTTEDDIRAESESDRHSWGYKNFFLLSKLGYDLDQNTQYLKDDTLYFRVSVKVADHKPWLECIVK